MLLTVVDAGLGACFFGLPPGRIGAFRAEFGVPPQFAPIGAISVGYSDEPPRDLRDRAGPRRRSCTGASGDSLSRQLSPGGRTRLPPGCLPRGGC